MGGGGGVFCCGGLVGGFFFWLFGCLFMCLCVYVDLFMCGGMEVSGYGREERRGEEICTVIG